jgi:hypothetical protein
MVLISKKQWLKVFEGDDTPVTFSQEQVDEAIQVAITKATTAATAATEKHKTDMETMQSEMTALQQRSDLTVTERKDLEKRIKLLSTKQSSVEDELNGKIQTITTERNATVDTLTAQAEGFKGLFSAERIGHQIAASSLEFGAYDSEQIRALVAPRTTMTEELDSDGKATGKYLTTVAVDREKDGVVTTVQLTIAKAVEEMFKNPKYANLFKGTGKGGGGSEQNRAPANIAGVDMARLKTDHAYYVEMRKAGKI